MTGDVKASLERHVAREPEFTSTVAEAIAGGRRRRRRRSALVAAAVSAVVLAVSVVPLTHWWGRSSSAIDPAGTSEPLTPEAMDALAQPVLEQYLPDLSSGRLYAGAMDGREWDPESSARPAILKLVYAAPRHELRLSVAPVVDPTGGRWKDDCPQYLSQLPVTECETTVVDGLPVRTYLAEVHRVSADQDERGEFTMLTPGSSADDFPTGPSWYQRDVTVLGHADHVVVEETVRAGSPEEAATLLDVPVAQLQELALALAKSQGL